eukprot:Filipodium_phascolosomae@DN145_c0_g1_i1.p1
MRHYNSGRRPSGRHILDGVIFRASILLSKVPRLVPSWTKPIVIGRHGHGDEYKAQDLLVLEEGTLELVFTPKSDGEQKRWVVKEFDEGSGPGCAMGMFNTDESIRGFAEASFCHAFELKMPLYMTTKNTILK